MNKDKQTNLLTKTPPNDLELEQEVIGCLLLYPDNLSKVKEILGETGDKAFYNLKMNLIYKALLEMDEQEIPIAAETASPFIKKKFKENIPSSLLALLVDIAIPEGLLEYQLKKLKELSIKRQMQLINLKGLQSINDGADIDQVKQDLIDDLTKIKITEERERPLTALELLKADLPKEPYLIGKGLLPKQGYTMIVGKSKEGKTMLALNFALCLAEGIPIFMGENDKRGLYPVPHKAKTLFLFRENAPQQIREIILKQGKGLEELLNRKIEEETFNLISFLRPKTVYLDIKEGQRELERIIKANPVDLVVIDPLSRFVAKDINKMEVVTGMANFLDSLGGKYGCAFLLLHHFRKLQAGGKPEEDPFERITGSAGLRNSMVSGIVMERKSERRSRNIKEFSFEFRNEESPDPISIMRNSETLLFEPITEEEALEGSSSVIKLVELMKKEFKNGISHTTICDIASKKFGVTKQRINELLGKGKKEGVIGKEKGRTGKWFVISQGKLSYDTKK